MARPGERELTPNWSYEVYFIPAPAFRAHANLNLWALQLIALSFCISWLGTYISTQVIIHAKYSRTPAIRCLWTFLASLAFGLAAVWSEHFGEFASCTLLCCFTLYGKDVVFIFICSVGIFACRFDVQITFSIPFIILSAVVAVVFTFAIFFSEHTSKPKPEEHSLSTVTISKWSRSIQSVLRLPSFGRHAGDPEAASLPVTVSDIGANERSPLLASDNDNETIHRSIELEVQSANELLRSPTESEATAISDLGHIGPWVYTPPATTPQDHPERRYPSRDPTESVSSSVTYQETASTLVVRNSSVEPSTLARRSLASSSPIVSISDTTLPSRSWSERVALGNGARIKVDMQDSPVLDLGWRYWLRTYYAQITSMMVARATIWGLAIVFVHYCSE